MRFCAHSTFNPAERDSQGAFWRIWCNFTPFSALSGGGERGENHPIFAPTGSVRLRICLIEVRRTLPARDDQLRAQISRAVFSAIGLVVQPVGQKQLGAGFEVQAVEVARVGIVE